MKIKYNDELYRIDLISFIKIYFLKFILLLKRIKRLLIRLFAHNIQLLIICFILIILSIIFIILGIKLEIYSSIIQGIWDFKDILLTSIIITLIVNTMNKEISRHNDLQKQYSNYIDLLYISEDYICAILQIINITYNNDIFTTEDIHENFIRQIKNKKILKNNKLLSELNITIKEYFEFISNQYIKKLFITKSYLMNMQNEHYSYSVLEQINYCIEEIEKEILKINHMEDKNIVKEIYNFSIDISNSIFPIMVFIRKPWRWDSKINHKIYTLVKDNGNLIEDTSQDNC